MYFKKLLLLILASAFFSYSILSAQNNQEVVKKVMAGELISDLLLPLGEMQQMAIENSPLLKYHDSQVLISELRIKAERRDWMNTLDLEASARYGLFDNLLISEDLNTEAAASTTEQTRYSVGVSLKIPLSKIVDRTNVKQAKAELDKYRYQQQSIERELRQLVVVQYNNVLKCYKSVEVRNKAFGVLNIHLNSVEKDYVSGKIDIAEFSRVHDIKMNAELELERAKIELISSMQVLNEIVGKPVILKN
ncbi:TolC family protein [Marinifilum sp.]|uniref:TolC family protein n=1 Tax=Marinifilum sp. TaxID=2033137 RepID=UPI003BA9DD47